MAFFLIKTFRMQNIGNNIIIRVIIISAPSG